MRIDVITIFPGLIEHFGGESLLGRAQQRGLLDLRVHDLRDATTDAHRTVDDTPFGGGAGMVLMAGAGVRDGRARAAAAAAVLVGPTRSHVRSGDGAGARGGGWLLASLRSV